MTPLEILSKQFREVFAACGGDPLLPAESGIYLLIHRGEVIYVGASADVRNRISQHQRMMDEGYARDRTFDRAMYTRIPDRVLNHYEGAFIRKLAPRSNRSCPRFRGNDNEILIGFGLEPHKDQRKNANEFRAKFRALRREARGGVQ